MAKDLLEQFPPGSTAVSVGQVTVLRPPEWIPRAPTRPSARMTYTGAPLSPPTVVKRPRFDAAPV